MMDAADRELFEQSLRHAAVTSSGPALDAALVDLGWHDALAVDRRAAISTLFELQGRAAATSSALGSVLAHALGLDAPAVVLPTPGSWAPPGRLVDGRLAIDGLGSAGLDEHDRVLVAWMPDGDDDGESMAAVIDGRSLTVEPIGGIDPDLGLVRVTGALTVPEAAPAEWAAAVDLGRLAVAHELVGASRTMLDLARTHALEREQFGRAIAGFQAVRHRLAEALVAIEGAEALVDAAWLEGTPEAGAMAKAVAGRGARTVARHSQQVLAGIGFTTEHPFHTSLRRILVLDQLLGSARALTTSLGATTIEQRALPPLLPL